MKRYLVFSGDSYYPCGGWDDFVGDFDSLVEAFKAAKQNDREYGWWHVIDLTTREEVKELTIEATP